MKFQTTEYTEYTESLAAGPTIPEGFNDETGRWLRMLQTAPAAAAVVKALRATEKRMEKSLSKNKKMNRLAAELKAKS